MKLICVILLSLFLPCTLPAADIRVSTTAAFNAALQKVQPGDSITWENGTYMDVQIDFAPAAKGTVQQPICLRAATPGKVVFKGRSRLFIGGDHLLVSGFLFEGASTLDDREDVIVFRKSKGSKVANHCRLTDCALLNYTPANKNINNDWIILYGTHNEVDHCSLIGKTNQGPFLVVAYNNTGSASYHRVHHNYFGKRSMPTNNGGEDIRVGDSKTSMTEGYNIFEYNYFEGEEHEPEIISNKSCNNIYRYNVFTNCDGALVLRHGNRCLVYGNYINGRSGRGYSGGIRVIGKDHTVFNNYLENQEGGDQSLKAPITIMSGVPDSPLNGYFPADSAVICFNTVVNAVGPVIRAGVKNHTDNPVAAKAVVLAQNYVIRPQGKTPVPFRLNGDCGFTVFRDNLYTGNSNADKGFKRVTEKEFIQDNGIWHTKTIPDNELITLIQQRTAWFKLTPGKEDITVFNKGQLPERKDTGVSWR